jgi:hypothetical protein
VRVERTDPSPDQLVPSLRDLVVEGQTYAVTVTM